VPSPKATEDLNPTRRRALKNLAAFLAGSPLLQAQQDPFRDHSRVPGLDELKNAFDFEALAFEKLPRQVFNYTAHGTAGEFTVRRNREAFDWVRLVPQALSGVSEVDASTEVLGTKMKFPIMLSPSAAHNTLHAEGEHGTYEGATNAAGTPVIISYVTSTPFPEVAEAEGGPLWYQLYPREDIPENRENLYAAQEAGAEAIVITVDQEASWYERRLHDRNLSAASRRPRRPSREKPSGAARYRVTSRRLWYQWDLFSKLREYIRVPMVAKGIMTGEDAARCVDEGLDAIMVSNHGGRAMDYCPSTIEVLPEVVEAVDGRIPVLIDGGFRRGSDILKALALGADAVSLGRVPRWGLAAFGAEGVQRVLEIMQAELVQAMLAAGCANLAAVNDSIVRTDWR